MEEIVSNREYTCSFIKQDDLAYVAKIKRWVNMDYEWMSVVKKKVVIEECSPRHKSGWITIDPDEET